MHTIWSANRSSLFASVFRTRAQTLTFWRPVILETVCKYFGDPFSRSLLCSLAVHGLRETIALSGEDHNMGVMDQPVNKRGGNQVVATTMRKDGTFILSVSIFPSIIRSKNQFLSAVIGTTYTPSSRL